MNDLFTMYNRQRTIQLSSFEFKDDVECVTGQKLQQLCRAETLRP